MPIEVKIDVKELRRASGILKARSAGNLLRGLEGIMRREMQTADRELVLNLTNKVLKRRTGNLARSVRHEVRRTSDRVIGTFGILKPGPAQKYASIHITGGRIPRSGDASPRLKIPLRAALTGTGAASATVPADLKVIPVRSGKVFLGKPLGKGKFIPFFILKRYVMIPKRDYFTPVREKAIRRVTEGASNLLAGIVSLKE